MSSRPPLTELPDVEALRLVHDLSSTDGQTWSKADQAALVRSVRDRSPELARAVDESLLGQIGRLRAGVREIQDRCDELRGVLEKLTSTPWFPGFYLGAIDAGQGPAAIVARNGSMRLVGLADGVRVEELSVGDEVLLGQDLNVIMRKAPVALSRTGDTAEFVQTLTERRLLLKHGEDHVVVEAAASLDIGSLSTGERIRWDRSVGIAFECIERNRESQLFLEETPTEGFERIGGLDGQIAHLLRALRLHLRQPETAGRYQVRHAKSVLLVGSPGTGKTMIARALAHWLARESRAGRSRFMSIKPAELHSMWYGQSEANYREAFRIAREAGAADPRVPIVMFFDEVDAVGGVRGHGLHGIDDRVLTSFMTELDGLEPLGNILVVAATNRRDTLDPALARPGRLGDIVIEIPRPGMAAATAIFDKHLPASIPYAHEGDETGFRQRLIDMAVSRLYAPNGEGAVAAMTFRDGTRRTLAARDLISGASIANIARAALERACQREIDGGAPGLRAADLLDAITDELATATAALTPANCRAYVSDLPQDITVVRVEPLVRQVRRPHRFMHVA